VHLSDSRPSSGGFPLFLVCSQFGERSNQNVAETSYISGPNRARLIPSSLFKDLMTLKKLIVAIDS
jgi:hypothetical protein